MRIRSVVFPAANYELTALGTVPPGAAIRPPWDPILTCAEWYYQIYNNSGADGYFASGLRVITAIGYFPIPGTNQGTTIPAGTYHSFQGFYWFVPTPAWLGLDLIVTGQAAPGDVVIANSGRLMVSQTPPLDADDGV